MKTLRVILLIIAYLNIVFVVLGIIGVLREGAKGNAAIPYAIGIALGVCLCLIPAFLCFYFAKRIKRKLNRKEVELVFDSLPG